MTPLGSHWLHPGFRLGPMLVVAVLGASFSQIMSRSEVAWAQETSVVPDIATDGQRIYLRTPPLQGENHVVLAGSRYNVSLPKDGLPDGEGRESMYWGCQLLGREQGTDLEGRQTTRHYFLVPKEAPSGNYVVRLLSQNCAMPPATPADCAECRMLPTLLVVPSYMVTTVDQLLVTGNSEDDDDNPAELKFFFSSQAGTPRSADTVNFPMVEFSGTYPGGGEGSSHLTNADNTRLHPSLPVLVAGEARVTQSECEEEAVSFPAQEAGRRRAECEEDARNGRFRNRYEYAVNGVEYDDSPSPAWGYIIGIGAVAAKCALTSCLADSASTLALGKVVSDQVNKTLKDEDDKLGVATGSFDGDVVVDREQAPVRLDGSGNVSIAVSYHRVGAPKILHHSVTLRSLKVLEGYEVAACREPNEIFVNGRALLYANNTLGSTLGEATRLPAAPGVWSIKQGETRQLGVVVQDREFPVESAPESPVLYIEFGVWEDDSEKDLMGLHSETIRLADFLSNRNHGEQAVSREGYFTRTVTSQRTFTVHGYTGSDKHCPGAVGHARAPSAEQGRVELTFDVAVTGLLGFPAVDAAARATISRSYQEAFGRFPWEPEVTSWLDRFRTDPVVYPRLVQLHVDWLGSSPGAAEMAEVIKRSYREVFGRDATQSEVTTWLESLRAKPTSYAKLVQSHLDWLGGPAGQGERPEVVTRSYTVALGRDPTPTEQQRWVQRLVDERLTYQQVVGMLR